MLKRLGVSLFTVFLLTGCGEQQAEAVNEAKSAAQVALEQVKKAASVAAKDVSSQAQDAITEMKESGVADQLIEQAGEQAVQLIGGVQKAAVEAIQEGKDATKEALKQ